MNTKAIISKPIQKGKEVFIADTATVLGDVQLGDECSVWYGAVVRGDRDKISIGSRTNIQDMAVIHVDDGFPVELGEEVIVGHSAVVHGAKIANNVLIGIHSTVLNGATIGEFSIIGAHALVTPGMHIPPFSLVFGSPAKVVSKLTEEQIKGVKRNAETYVELSKHYLELYDS
jgi:carbonic anhydrase/acetyltransferase-like protein (isoleucine patch superfamily)